MKSLPLGLRKAQHPVTVFQFKSGAHASLHFHRETGCFFVGDINSEERSMERGVNFSPAD